MIRVLLVDDDPSIRLFFTDFFEGVDDMVLLDAVTDGRAGLIALAYHCPHVVLLDLVMPHLTGLGVLHELATMQGERPVVLVLSQVSTPEIVNQVIALGASFYLLKPVNMAELPRLIRRLTAKGRVPHCAQSLLLAMGERTPTIACRHAATAIEWLARAQEEEAPLKAVYYHVAKENHTTVQCVEKNIRTLVSRLMVQNTPAWQALWDEPPKKKPTNGIFLRQMAKSLRASKEP